MPTHIGTPDNAIIAHQIFGTSVYTEDVFVEDARCGSSPSPDTSAMRTFVADCAICVVRGKSGTVRDSTCEKGFLKVPRGNAGPSFLLFGVPF